MVAGHHGQDVAQHVTCTSSKESAILPCMSVEGQGSLQTERLADAEHWCES